MKHFFILFFILSLKSPSQDKIPVTQKGWLVYRHGDMLAFLPLKDQSKTPTYTNFFTEDKGYGQRMNNCYSAPYKLLIAKTFLINTYEYNLKSKGDSLLGRFKYYIQPVKYIYNVESIEKDTADYSAGGWTFLINGKLAYYPVFHFIERSGKIHFLNYSDSIFAKKGGRRKTISIYPPH